MRVRNPSCHFLAPVQPINGDFVNCCFIFLKVGSPKIIIEGWEVKAEGRDKAFKRQAMQGQFGARGLISEYEQEMQSLHW